MNDPLLAKILEAEQQLAFGNLDAASEAAELALVNAPPHAGLALNVLGHIAAHRRENQLALNLWETATRAAPAIPQPWVSLGGAHFELQQFDRAISCFREALRRDESLTAVRMQLGIALQHAGQHQQAIDELRAILTHDPSNPEGPVALATSLHELGRTKQAIEALEQSAAQHPNHLKTLSNLGVLHEKIDQFEHAITWYDKALALNPDDAQTLFNRGSSRIQLLQTNQTRDDWQRALQLDPEHATIANNLAILELLDGNLTEGFELFEARWKVRHQKFPIPYPEWDGSPLGSKHLLLFVEQGLGDALQFCRYIPILKHQHPNATFTIATLPTLHDLLRSLAGLSSVVDIHPPYPRADLSLSLLSIPRVLKTTLDTIPADTPYLHAPTSLARTWKQKLDDLTPSDKPRVGLFWQGTQVEPRRTIRLEQLQPLFDQSDRLTFISLQKGQGEEELEKGGYPVTPIGHQLLTYADTAAVLEHLDLVITIDTSLAHAAGALARPTWTLLPYRPDWRWLLHRNDCPWYPAMRLYRQSTRNDWSEPLAQIANDLRTW
ncbi:MAG: tetratricopeptide repeat-containing glycosyltransferase family protein [Phycisphaeraceae bacterium]